MKKKYAQSFYRILLTILFTFSITYISSAQVVIANQGFQGIDTADQVNASGDNWTYTRTHSNGNSFITNTPSFSTPKSLQLDNYWNDNSYIAFDAIDISSQTGVVFSIAYEASGSADINDNLFLVYEYFDGGVWNIFNVNLVNGADGTGDNQPFGTAGIAANPYSVPIPDTATNFRATIRGQYNSDNGGDHDVYYIDDIVLTAAPSPNPIAADDNLSVVKNSTTGATNQIDVSLNDSIGTTEGTDGDDYSISTDPLTTANGGTVTEVSDGIFEYIPATDYIGSDSFSYILCDAGGDCDTSLVTINVNLGQCIPTSVSNGFFIDNFNLSGPNPLLTSIISNNSGDDGGYGDYSVLGAYDLYKGDSYDLTIDAIGSPVGFAVYIDFNQNGDFTDPGEVLYDTAGTEGSPMSTTISIPASALFGTTIMRIGTMQYYSANNPCSNANPGEFEDYLVNIIIDPSSPQDIDVIGNNIFIDLGATQGDLANNTNYGLYDINSGAITKTFAIVNNGALDLVLLGVPTIQVLTNGVGNFTDFSIVDYPDNNTITSGNSENFTIAFDPSSVGMHEALISISSNDPDENPFTFTVVGEGALEYADTDGDGVPDNKDGDDDNDGLLDFAENSTCLSYPNSGSTEVIFLEETFGAGLNRTIISSSIEGATSYCFEDGTGSCTPDDGYEPTSLGDGEYTIHHTVTNGNGIVDDINTDISLWAENYWYTGTDHTGDTNGRMVIVNATQDPGIFYGNSISGVTIGVEVTYSFWVLNIDRTDAPCLNGTGNDENGNPCPGTRNRPNVAIQILDPYNNIIASNSSGEIAPTTAGNLSGDWVEVSGSFIAPYGSLVFVLTNLNPGGLGNDLALDDIVFKQVLCDLDGDGIADVIDLDNDNDGIPNVVELGLADNDYDATVLNDPTNVWLDLDQDGVHDSYDPDYVDAVIPIDSDGDGTPDYIDLDSDNDGIYDSVEYDGYGDIDITGNGLGNGSDQYDASTENEQDGDGILGIIDLNDDKVGNDHGSTNYPDPIDSDGDGIPNYLDVDSNDATNNTLNGSDIDNTIYTGLDLDNDGSIDGNADADSDGLLDLFDTDDTSFGSPRNLDDSYTLFFDGRNDYVSENTPVIDGWASATLMAWIKINSGSGQRRIAGQDNFYITVNSDNTFSAIANGITVTSTSTVPNNIWIHIAASYNNTDGDFVLYINGQNEGIVSASGNLAAGTTDLTIGRRPGVSGQENILTSEYFEGEIDEVRVFNAGLTEDEIQKMVYQELDETNNFDSGKIIPLNITTGLGATLVRYYKMDGYKDDILDDKTTGAIDLLGAKIYNIKDIYFQTAPLPYQTTADGTWANTATWLYGSIWDITDETNNKDWSIVDIQHNVTTSSRHGTSGLLVKPNVKLEINDDVELFNSWYLNLEGFIDLEGESQLVQTPQSNLVVGINGALERDQQGTENLYTYNYWSSPVHTFNPNSAIDGDEAYTIGNVLMDGTDALNPVAINFITGYNGSNTTNPIKISNYWMWKYANSPANTYAEWQQVKHTGTLKVGEGYTMKGSGTGPVYGEQNYVFKGKPNNGEILLTSNSGNEYLVGNPYPSAIDANQFLLDNTHTNGSLYFWEHFGGSTHVTTQYQGGYGVYNFSGGIPPVSHPSLINSGTPLKTPRRYIPVGQGFFVNATSDGNVKFENGQRIFVTETGNTNSWFFRNSNTNNPTTSSLEDLRPKFRFGYKSPQGYGRQILLTVDQNASLSFDWGYDAIITEENSEDMFWNINNDNYFIQGVDATEISTILPLTIKTSNGGIIEINIDALENVDESVDIYLKDNNVYHNLRESQYITTVEAGIINNRFEIVFADNNATTLSNEEFQTNNNITLFVENNDDLIISNPKNQNLKTLEVINMLGQIIIEKELNSNDNKIKFPLAVQTGAYLFIIKTANTSITKKMILN